PEPVRALRPLSRLLPDVLGARHRDGLAARADLPGEVARGGTHRTVRLHRAAPVALSRLPRVRDGVSGRSAVRPADRGGEGRDRAAAPGRCASPRVPLAELRALARPAAA